MWALGASCYYGVWFAECYIHVSVSKVVCLVVLICRVLCLNCPNIVATIASSSNLRVSKEVSFLCPMSLRSSADPMFLNCWTVYSALFCFGHTFQWHCLFVDWLWLPHCIQRFNCGEVHFYCVQLYVIWISCDDVRLVCWIMCHHSNPSILEQHDIRAEVRSQWCHYRSTAHNC